MIAKILTLPNGHGERKQNDETHIALQFSLLILRLKTYESVTCLHIFGYESMLGFPQKCISQVVLCSQGGTVVLEKILESPLDCKEIQPVHSEGDQPWDFFGR